MMQATDFWNWDDHARARRLAWPSLGCVLVEREMSAGPVIVGEVAGQGAAQVSFAQDDDMIETLAADRADEPLGVGVLPRAGGRRQHFKNPHALQPLPEHVTVDAVAIAKEIGRRGVVREGIDDLLGGPGGGRMLGHVEVDDAPAVVSEHDENKKDAQARGWHREEIEGDQIADMVGEERPPGLRRQGAPLGHEPRDGALGDVEPVAQGQVLQGDMAVSAAEEGKHSKQAEQEGDHRAEIFSGSAPPDQSLWRRTGFWRRTRVLARVYLHPRTLGGVLGRFAGRGRPGQVVQGERVWLHDVYWLTNPRFGATASSFRGCQRTSCAANQLEIGRGA